MNKGARRKRSGWILLVMGVGSVGLGLLLWFQTGGRPAPNLLLITVDTLRADHLGAYGYRRATSPNLDALAKESLLYRRAFSQAPETNPSLSSLMTSHYPHETQVLRNYHQLQPALVTLAELLQAAGWRTGAVVSNTSLLRGSGFEQGFDDYDDEMENRPIDEGLPVERTAPKTTAVAIQWLQRHAQDRFFLWVHYMDPHAPYLPPAPYATIFEEPATGKHKTLPFISRDAFLSGHMVGGIPPNAQLGAETDPEYYVARYDGEIRYFDQWFGTLMNQIRTLGLLDKSLVILTSDHGEGMGEHDYYFSHVQFVYSGLIHVPLLVRLPESGRQGRQDSTPVSLVDLLPTILQLLKVESPQNLRGSSLLDPPQSREIWTASAVSGQAAMIANGRKLIVSPQSTSLYDLEKDFYETRDLLETGDVAELEVARALRETMAGLRGQDELRLGPPIEWAAQPEMKQKLKALGYVQ